MNITLIIFLVIILIISISFLSIDKHSNNNILEKYKSEINNEPILKYNVITKNVPIITIYKNYLDFSNKLNSITNTYNNIKVETKLNNTDLHYTDAYTFYKNFKTKKVLTICSEPKHLLLISNKDIELMEIKQSSEGEQNEDEQIIKTKIGYFNDIDKDLLIKVIKSQKNYVTLDNFEFEKVNSINCLLNNNQALNDDSDDICNTNEVDILIYFNTMSNPLLDVIKNKGFKLVSYNTKIAKLYSSDDNEGNTKLIQSDSDTSLDMDLLKHYLPFSKKKIQLVDNSIDKISIYNTLLIDTLIFVNNYNEDYNEYYLNILNYFNEFLKINYYLQHFNFLKLSEEWSLQIQNSAKFLNVVENFEAIKFKINKQNLNYNNKSIINNATVLSSKNGLIKYKVDIVKLNEIPIKVGDKLYMDINDDINQPYYVVDVKSDHIIIENAYKLEIDLNNNIEDENNKFYIKLDKKILDKNNLEYGDNIFIKNINIISKIINKNTGNDTNLYLSINKDIYQKSVTNINSRFDDDYDRLYNCYDHPYISDEITCKSNGFIWDRKCMSNEECPFYLKNKNYINDRGGCVNGFCELPLGIKRLSYRNYDEELKFNNYPRCNGCKDLNEEDEMMCCENQKKNSKGPDYIFENEKRNSNFTIKN